MELTPWDEVERRAEEERRLAEIAGHVAEIIVDGKRRMRDCNAVLPRIRAKLIPDSQLEMVKRTVEIARLGGTSQVLGEG
jgi:hypothetical protein